MFDKKILRNKIISLVICAGVILLLFMSVKSSAFAQLTGTVSASSANIRQEASTTSKVLASVVRNDEVSIAGEVTDANGTLWYQIHVDANTKGYIAASLVTKAGDSEPVTSVLPSTTTTTTATESPSTEIIAPQDEWKSATILIESVRVREGASTSTETVATVTQGVVVTVTGSKSGTDSMEWYQVLFSVDGIDYQGFIRSDLLTFDSELEDSTTQVDGTLDPNSEDGDLVEVETPEPEATQAPTEESMEKAYTIINTDMEVEVPSGYIEVPISTDLGEVTGWKNGDFYIVYAKTNTGEQGWYRYDSLNRVYQRYEESESVNALENKSDSSNKIIIYILAGTVTLLFIIAIFLIVRLSDMKADLQYADDDDDDDGYEETFEEEYDDDGTYEERRDIRRNQKDDIRLARDLEHVLEKEQKNNDPEEYLKPDEEDDWDEGFDFIDIE